jgi:hypothetical protein
MTPSLDTRILLAAYLALALVCVGTGAYLRVTPGPPDYPTLGHAWEPVKPQRSCGVWKYKYTPLFEGLTDSKLPPDFDWHWGRFGATLPRQPHYSSIGR